MGKGHRFNRRIGFKLTKKLFLIASEGAETEPRYFEEIKLGVSRNSIIRVRLVGNPNHKSHPNEVLKRLIDAAKAEGIKSGDELWLVIDRDAWDVADLNQVCKHAMKSGFSVVLSNPCFELWLFLHLQNNRHFVDRHHCQRELGKICKSYGSKGKSGYDAKSLMTAIAKAIQRAKVLDVRPKDPWPKNQATRVYLLVEKLLIGISSTAEKS
jgi:hypothetical protein